MMTRKHRAMMYVEIDFVDNLIDWGDNEQQQQLRDILTDCTLHSNEVGDTIAKIRLISDN